MRRFRNPLFALLLSLQLLGGQQAALAHMLSHVPGDAAASSAVPAMQQEDAGHGATLVLSHVCTTCLAVAGLDVAPPLSIFPLAPAAGRMAAPAVVVPRAPTLRLIAAFHSRAPPLL